jgi:hypothetical protein
MASNATSTTGGRLQLGTHVDGKRFAVGAGIVLAVLAVAIGVTVPGRSTDGQAAWEKSLNARSDALNQRYGLGAYAVGAAGAPASDAHRALQLRSEALNQKYGLGVYSAQSAPAASASQTFLRLRSEALNQKYGLGAYGAASASQTALRLRSEALNQKYALGAYAIGTANVQAANWHRGLSARNALNLKYGSGSSQAAGAYRAYEAGNYATALP